MPGTKGHGGPKPKPVALKLLTGNPGRRPMNDAEPRYPVRLPNAPEHLTAAGKAEWRRVGRMLVAQGVMTPADRAALAAYCQAWALWVDASEKLEKYGSMLVIDGHPVPSPYLRVVQREREQVVRFAAEFGMTPSSRTRIHAAPRQKASDDPAAEFFGF